MNPLLSGSILAASMLLGQTPAPPTLPPLGAKGGVRDAVPTPLPSMQTQGPVAPQRPVANWFSREDRPIITKIQSWFKRDAQTPPTTPEPPIVQPTSNPKIRDAGPPLTTPSKTPAAPADFPRKLPNPSTKANAQTTSIAKESSKAPTKVEQTTLQQAPPAPAAKSPILPQWSEKIGRDEKFEWVTGQIELENGNYVVYYATPETIDKYNGRMVLLPQTVDMKSFHRGDLVSLRGQLGQRQTLQGATAVYRLTDANLIERPKQ